MAGPTRMAVLARLALRGSLAAAIALIAGGAGPALAASPGVTLSGQVEIWENSGGQMTRQEDRRNAVIFVTGFSEPPDSKKEPQLAQKDKWFVPRVLVVTQGQQVNFPNEDPVFHNVWSRSPAGPFDLGLYKAPETRALRFATQGIVTVFCNIHPQMISTVLVVPNRRFAVTGPDGKYRIQGIPPGEHAVYAWVEGAQPIKQVMDFELGKPLQLGFRLVLQRIPLDHLNKEGKPYQQGAPTYKAPSE